MATKPAAAFIICFIANLAIIQAQVPPTLPPPVTLPPNFKCPRSLIFAFECRCYFNRVGRLEIFPFEEFTCKQRAAAIKARPILGFIIAKACKRNYGFLDEITGPLLRGAQDAIFNKCPRVLNRLCPDNPDYKVLECSCFLLQTGILPTSNPQAIEDCNKEWGEVTPQNKLIRARRCRVSIRFKDFVGGILGLTGRQCFAGGHTNCCNALPGAPQ